MEQYPKHIGIIMDGNGRWATERNLPRMEGHKAGAKNLKRLLKHILKKDIPCVSIFAFSTENFRRSQEEVQALMTLFMNYFDKELSFLIKQNVRVCFSGRAKPLPEGVLKNMRKLEEMTKNNGPKTLNICINYGGQDELVDAVKAISEEVQAGQYAIEEIDRNTIEEHLYQKLPPLDFVIRTSGEQRISNFMLWQSAYAEYYFPKVYFPDFDEEAFDESLMVYQNRNRRYGGDNEKKNS